MVTSGFSQFFPAGTMRHKPRLQSSISTKSDDANLIGPFLVLSLDPDAQDLFRRLTDRNPLTHLSVRAFWSRHARPAGALSTFYRTHRGYCFLFVGRDGRDVLVFNLAE